MTRFFSLSLDSSSTSANLYYSLNYSGLFKFYFYFSNKNPFHYASPTSLSDSYNWFRADTCRWTKNYMYTYVCRHIYCIRIETKRDDTPSSTDTRGGGRGGVRGERRWYEKHIVIWCLLFFFASFIAESFHYEYSLLYRAHRVRTGGNIHFRPNKMYIRSRDRSLATIVFMLEIPYVIRMWVHNAKCSPVVCLSDVQIIPSGEPYELRNRVYSEPVSAREGVVKTALQSAKKARELWIDLSIVERVDLCESPVWPCTQGDKLR